jgi:hypothetical protein
LEALEWKMLIYFMAIWNILWSFVHFVVMCKFCGHFV